MEYCIFHYRILGKIGEGGMGLVFGAEDTKLGRHVAIKVLPASVATRVDRSIRLLTEARTAASLNHPHVCTIHEVGELSGDTILPYEGQTIVCPAGTPYIVMELLRGQTLHALLSQTGPLPVVDLVEIAVQIADALVAAHARQIVHRDLKPRNVMVSADGVVKILDFGLAKPFTAPEAIAEHATTLTGDVTLRGHVVGTPAYMSPEQARGAPVDSRSDVFSFGTMLYEMATAERPFQGQSITETLAKILEVQPPPLGVVRAGLPADLERIIRRCMQKKPADRYNDTRDLLADLKALRQSIASGVEIDRAGGRAKRRGRITGAVAIGAVALVLVGTALLRLSKERTRAQPASFKQVTFAGDASLPAASPDGQFLAFVTGDQGAQKTIVLDLSGGRTLEIFTGRRISSVEWSSDGTNVFVSDEAGIHVVPRLGGAPRLLPRIGYRTSPSPDGSEIAGIAQGVKQVHVLNTVSGAIRSFAVNESIAFMVDVDWSPIGDWLLFSALRRDNRLAVWITRPDGSGMQSLFDSEFPQLSARWAPTGDAIYYLEGNADTKDLWKLAIERKSGRAAGRSVHVLSGLEAAPDFHVFHDGRHLTYRSRTNHSNLWLGEVGTSAATDVTAERLTTGTMSIRQPSFSSDGTRIAYASGNATGSNIFVRSIDGTTPQQLTFMTSMNGSPVWSPDGRTIAFGSTEGGSARVWEVPVAGGVPRPFANTLLSIDSLSLAWAPGRDIIYQRAGKRNLSTLAQDGSESPFLTNEQLGWIHGPTFSPDGKELAAAWIMNDAMNGATGIFVFPVVGSMPREQHARRVSGPLGFGGIRQSVDATSFRGRDIKLVAHVRTQVTGDNAAQCWLRVDRPRGQQGFFNNMADQKIRTPTWSAHEIVGRVDVDADRITFGCFLKTSGRVWVDDVALTFKNDAGRWAAIEIRNPGFEEADGQERPAGWTPPAPTYPGYNFRVTSDAPYQGKASVEISAVPLTAGQFVPVGWSADGRFIYASEQSDYRHVVAIPVEGGPAKPFLTLPVVEGRTINESRMSPDGHRIAFTVGESTSDVRVITNFDPSVR